MQYIGRERAFKRMSAYFRRFGEEQRFPIDEKMGKEPAIPELIEHIHLLADEFLIDCFTTADHQTLFLSSRRLFLFDTEMAVRVFSITDIRRIRFNENFKTQLEQIHPIVLEVESQPPLTLPMSDGPTGISLWNAIHNIRGRLYQ